MKHGNRALGGHSSASAVFKAYSGKLVDVDTSEKHIDFGQNSESSVQY